MSHKSGKYESEWSRCEKKSKVSMRIITNIENPEDTLDEIWSYSRSQSHLYTSESSNTTSISFTLV